MSKRSSRRKRQEHQKKVEARLTAPVLFQQGSQAFRQADYNGAIKAWEQARGKPNTPTTVAVALAEAYFRRGVSQPSSGFSDLQQAAKLQPRDQCYRYHLALAHHRQGNLTQAEPIYRQLLAESPPFSRAAVPLAQLLIEQKRPIAKDPVWEQLNAAEKTELTAAEALIRGKAPSTLNRLAAEPLHPLWQGLVAVALNDRAAAQQNLQPLADAASSLPSQARSVARYYLGSLAAAAGQTEAALAHWQAAQADGLDTYHLRHNLSALAYEQAIKAQQAGQPGKALEWLDQVRVSGDNRDEVRQFYHQLKWDLAYTAAQKGDWQQALLYWQQVEQAGDDSRRLTLNLALAYQHQGHYWEAAEHWRTLLRRRPRKADHPDALTDQQVARIWQNIAENYSKVEDYEEAITTYKNAVKWDPENIDLRLQLVEAYQSEGRWQAAENELNRILDKNPNHIKALTLLAESYSDDYFPGQARKLWLRILELEPDNPVARQQLAHSYVQEGSRYTMWGDYQRAINIFNEGLKQAPNNQQLLTVIGGTYADWHKFKEARTYLEQARAINPTDLQTLHTIFMIWLSNNAMPEIQQTLEHINAVPGPVPGGLFLDLFERCRQFKQDALAEKILVLTKERYRDDDEVMIGVAVGYSHLDQDNQAAAILRHVVQHNPTHIEANMQLGIVYYHLDQTRLAKRHWDKAEAQARKENNQMLLYKIKLVKDDLLYGKAPPSSPRELFKNLPPQVLQEMLKDAPPEVAAMLRNMSPDMLDMILSMSGLDDDLEDEEDFF
ncbi:MAG: tetratricopeptide repeat protein [Anaerolineales bacterium]|nr:tetratricopeptide repeat protein [Anaerolineales bacterium]